VQFFERREFFEFGDLEWRGDHWTVRAAQ
jgi:hypothetical protein